jgi:hypothetical protein
MYGRGIITISTLTQVLAVDFANEDKAQEHYGYDDCVHRAVEIHPFCQIRAIVSWTDRLLK